MSADLLAYINGDWMPLSQATVSVTDHGMQYGDGVFEGLGISNRRVYSLQEHVDRLWFSARYCRIDIGMTKDSMVDAVLETVRRNHLESGYMRLLVTRGAGPLGLEYSRDIERPTIVVIPQLRSKHSEDIRQNKGIRTIIARTRRVPPEVFDPRVKSCNYLNNLMAKFEQWDAGVDAAIMLDMRGFVAEGAGENIFCLQQGRLLTPRRTNILDGITRQTVIRLARASGVDVEEADLTPYDLYMAEEVFFTSTLTQICPITEIDRHSIGSGVPGPVAKDMLRRLRELMAESRHVAF
ncbi:MAG: branched-chain-amino-acid transaminase [Candidatus Rokubacteria bacterium]|nr:branched-chain-amino-acid transaminase [Candidatus Rokubacteria bacterium]